MKKQGLWQWFLLFIFLLFVSSCSGSSSSDGEFAESESIYDPGASIGAVSYVQAYGIEVLLLNQNETFIPVNDGDYIEPGKRTLGVQIEGDPENIDRVFLSNGGAYQVEAHKQGDLYVGQFDVSQESLYQNVLVQVIHNSGLASKEKIVLKTFEDKPENQFAKNGIGVLIAKEVVELQQFALADRLDEMLKDIIASIPDDGSGLISDLGYGDDNPDTTDIQVLSIEAVHTQAYPRAVLRISLLIHDVRLSAFDLYGYQLISTDNNDLLLDAYIAIEDDGEDGTIRFILDFSDSALVSFDRDFFMKSIVEEMLASELGRFELPPLSSNLSTFEDDLLADLPEFLLINGREVNLDALFDGLVVDLNKYLFADTYGIPESTGSEALSVGIGMYVADPEEVEWELYEPNESPSDPADMEDVFEELCEEIVADTFEEIRQEYEGLVTELSYGDGNPGTPDFIVNSFVLIDTADLNRKEVELSFTVKNVDFQAVSLFGFSVISTSNNDLTIDSSVNLEYRYADGNDMLFFDIIQVSDVSFSKLFFGREVVEEMIKADLEEMQESSYSLDDILDYIDLDLDVAASLLSGCDVPLFPDVTPYIQTPAWELVLSDPYNVACAVSQDNINWVLGDLLSPGFEWSVNEILVALLGEDFEGFSRENPEDGETFMYLNVPPVLDVRTSQIRVLVNDVVLQYRLAGEPQWEASVDLDIILDPRVENKEINFYLTQVPENTHFHVMRDNPGNLGIFDHSSLVNDILDGLPEMLGRSSEDPLITLNLEAFAPAVEFRDISSPISVSAGGGYLYINMATEHIDISQADLWEERCE